MKRIFSFLTLTLMPYLVIAQNEAEMADTMRSDGKIYVVVAILVVILFGLLGYLVMLDRKISKVEKQIKS